MATKVGVGKSNASDSFKAGCEAAKMAFSKAGINECDFVFLFATVGYNQEELLKGVRSVTKDAPLSGCSGEGIITQAGPEGEVMYSLSGIQKESEVAAVMVFSSGEMSFFNYLEKGVKENSTKAGIEIGKKINATMPENPLLVLMFPDGYTINTGEFFAGIEQTLEKPLLFSGGLSGHNLTQSAITYQYHNDQVLNDAAPCVLVSGNVKVEIGVNHGCLPVGLEKKITKAEGRIVYEINNKTTWSYFQEYLGEDIKELSTEISPSISIGIPLPEDMATEYDKYIIRAPVAQNPDNSMSFATGIPEGSSVIVVRRDEDKISTGAKKMAQRIKANLKGKEPIAVLHFDCAGRGKMFFGDKVKQKGIDVMQDVFSKDIPWIGFFCFGEIAPIKGVNHYHNQTAVLCVFYK